MDALSGFSALSACSMMEFDFVVASNCHKISKNIASLLWKLQRQNSNFNGGLSDQKYLLFMEGSVGSNIFWYGFMPHRDGHTT